MRCDTDTQLFHETLNEYTLRSLLTPWFSTLIFNLISLFQLVFYLNTRNLSSMWLYAHETASPFLGIEQHGSDMVSLRIFPGNKYLGAYQVVKINLIFCSCSHTYIVFFRTSCCLLAILTGTPCPNMISLVLVMMAMPGRSSRTAWRLTLRKRSTALCHGGHTHL